MSDSDMPPSKDLAFKPDAADAWRRLRAYWQGEIIDRACVSIRAPKDGMTPPKRSLIVAEDFDLPAAIDKFEASELMKDVLGEHIHEFYVDNKRAEWDAYRLQVSQWEIDRYLSVI